MTALTAALVLAAFAAWIIGISIMLDLFRRKAKRTRSLVARVETLARLTGQPFQDVAAMVRWTAATSGRSPAEIVDDQLAIQERLGALERANPRRRRMENQTKGGK